MSDFLKKADEFVFVAAAMGPWPFIIALVVIIGLVKACIPDGVDPLDNDSIKNVEIVEHVLVTDSTYNGFRVVYATAKPVTGKRFEEICGRKNIREGFDRLKREAPGHFGGSLLETDICDFALYAYNFKIDEDIRIHNIFVAGKKKMDFYVRPNPKLPGCAGWMHMGTEQGNQYLNFRDVNFYIPNGGRRYRYWKCRCLYDVSDTDERFSHFTEDERIY